MDLVEALGVRIGVRPAGSDAAAEAAEAIAQSLRDLGLEPRFQELTFLGYEPAEPELEVEGKRWDAGPCVYSTPTPDGGVEGEARRIGSLGFIPGLFEIAVFEVVDAAGTAVAHLFGAPAGAGAIPFPGPHGATLTGPAAYVSAADAERLDALPHARVRLRTRGRFLPGCRDRNVVAELPGESDEQVLVGAHFDSVWRGPGTVDNATGVEGLRRVAERLAGRRHPRSVVFCAFAAEELGLLGSKHYVTEAKIRSELGRLAGVVNLDCIAHGERLVFFAGPPELQGRALQAAAATGAGERYDVLTLGPVSGTDHYHFAAEGVPALSIGFIPYPEYHLPTESADLVDERKLADVVDLAVALVESQLARPVARA